MQTLAGSTTGTTTTTAPHGSARMLDIQGLRAVAVLLVVADHAGVGWLTGGFVGVDVFFVVSGYLITFLLLREADTRGGVRIGEFYARRARRILPAATVVLLATLAYAAQGLSVSQVQRFKDDATWSALFAANVHFAELGTDYFAQGRDPSPFRHYWSLAVEEQFYLVWPALLALVLVACRRSGSRGRSVLGALLLVIIALSLAWSVWITSAAPGTAYYSSPARAWELAVGALLATQAHRAGSLGRTSRAWLASAGLGAVVVSAVVFDAGSQLPGWRALLPVLGTAALVAAGVGGSSPVNRWLGVRPLTWIGDLSYSLYLWHWPILVLGPAHPALPEGPAGTAVLVLLALAASVVTFHLVEKPFRGARPLRAGRRALVLWPVAVGLVLMGAAQSEQWAAAQLEARIMGSATPLPDPAPAEPGRRDRRPHRPPAGPTLVERLTTALRAADSADPVPFPLVNLPDPTVGHLLGAGCRADPPEASTAVSRSATSPDAGRWSSRRLAGRPVAAGDPPDGREERGAGAAAHQARVPGVRRAGRGRRRGRLLAVHGVPQLGARLHRGCPARDRGRRLRGDVHPQPHGSGPGARRHLDRRGGQHPAPAHVAGRPRRGPVRHARPRLRPGRLPDRARITARRLRRVPPCRAGGSQRPHASGRARPRCRFVDTLDLLCVHDRCPLVVDRTLTFWDYSHVSPAWSAALADDLELQLRRALRDSRSGPSTP